MSTSCTTAHAAVHKAFIACAQHAKHTDFPHSTELLPDQREFPALQHSVKGLQLAKKTLVASLCTTQVLWQSKQLSAISSADGNEQRF